jgi:hypothetical protein
MDREWQKIGPLWAPSPRISFWDRPIARRAFAERVFLRVQILASHFLGVFFAQVSVQYGVILIRRRHDVMNAKCSVSEPNVALGTA